MIRHAALTACCCLLLAGQERIDSDVNERIRREATENSQVLRTVQYLTDVFGPRLTGSPQYRQAAEWAAQQASDWGLSNARLEAWNFGRAGWSNERAAAFVIAPFKETLVARAVAWTPGTAGRVTGECVQVVFPDQPTQPEFNSWLETQRERVRERVVLVGQRTVVPVNFTPPPLRLAAQDAAADPKLTPQQMSAQMDAFLKENASIARIYDAARPLGQVRAAQHGAYDVRLPPPSLIVRNEDYGRISRLLDLGAPVVLELEIDNRTHPEGRTAYNVIAEIPGGDLGDQVVILGGHIDSMHGATGATDNASGVAVMMEAARILTQIGVRPRRTIRLALWGGEEQGLLGSQAHVAGNYGTAESPRFAHSRVAGYFNLDSGTGRIRSLTVFGPQEAADVLSQLVAPFADLGVTGAVATRSRRLCCSDYTSFWAAGLPGITLTQDPIEYSASWHSNVDSFERIVEDDLKQAAQVVASAVYHLAMRDLPLPRFSPSEMPLPAGSVDADQRR